MTVPSLGYFIHFMLYTTSFFHCINLFNCNCFVFYSCNFYFNQPLLWTLPSFFIRIGLQVFLHYLPLVTSPPCNCWWLCIYIYADPSTEICGSRRIGGRSLTFYSYKGVFELFTSTWRQWIFYTTSLSDCITVICTFRFETAPVLTPHTTDESRGTVGRPPALQKKKKIPLVKQE